MDFKKNGIVVSVSDQVLEQLVLERLGNSKIKVAPTVPPGTFPRIGAEIVELGGIFAGIARGVSGANDYYLIVGPEAAGKLEWQKAIDWAEGLEQLGHDAFTLPTRKEQALLFANVPELFKEEYYWSSEQHAGNSYNAWAQDFYYGYQRNFIKAITLRARAVRRVPIQ